MWLVWWNPWYNRTGMKDPIGHQPFLKGGHRTYQTSSLSSSQPPQKSTLYGLAGSCGGKRWHIGRRSDEEDWGSEGVCDHSFLLFPVLCAWVSLPLALCLLLWDRIKAFMVVFRFVGCLDVHLWAMFLLFGQKGLMGTMLGGTTPRISHCSQDLYIHRIQSAWQTLWKGYQPPFSKMFCDTSPDLILRCPSGHLGHSMNAYVQVLSPLEMSCSFECLLWSFETHRFNEYLPNECKAGLETGSSNQLMLSIHKLFEIGQTSWRGGPLLREDSYIHRHDLLSTKAIAKGEKNIQLKRETTLGQQQALNSWIRLIGLKYSDTGEIMTGNKIGKCRHWIKAFPDSFTLTILVIKQESNLNTNSHLPPCLTQMATCWE